MAAIPQWFLWRLEWDGEENKYQKTPCALDGSVFKIDASNQFSEQPHRKGEQNWHSYEVVKFHQATLMSAPQCADKRLQYALGFWFTADCGYWFLDLDACVTDGVLTTFSSQMVDAFPGAMVEFSSSRRGVHVFGRAANIPQHRSRDIYKLHMEFYHKDRGVAFGLQGEAQGSADTYHDAMIAALVANYFPPAKEGEAGDFARARDDWRGPDDDDELIRRALSARSSAAAAFGGKLSFAQLWGGLNIADDQRSNADMALASHLAFWTGCDAPRIERLMRRSGLVRAKWDDHRTYLRELTIQRACAGCQDVYKEPQKHLGVLDSLYGVQPQPQADVPAPVVTLAEGAVITPELTAKVNDLLDQVSSCGTVEDMHNVVIPAIRNANVPAALAERLVRSINKRLELWDAKLPIARLRMAVCPPVVASATSSPLWVQKHCYVKSGDYFYDIETGAKATRLGFNAEYQRVMPLKDNGGREDAADWALHRWHMRTVNDAGYRPSEGPYFVWDNLEYVNKYNPNSVPVAMPLTEAGTRAIEAFKLLLWDMCGHRQDVYLTLLSWLAHNVQHPGKKIRWSPILKGGQGDGKSFVTVVLRAAMGWRNVGTTSNATLNNSGGFTDWAVGYAVKVFEEIRLTGKERYDVYNVTKDFITNDVININAKGKTDYVTWNVTNHIALTNYPDALPLDRDDRRWFVIFSPWENLQEMAAYAGVSVADMQARFALIDYGVKNCGGEFRSWFLSIPMSEGFNIDARAPVTPERSRMIATSRDDVESIAVHIIDEGAYGVTSKVLSSACLTNLLKTRAILEGFDPPKGMQVNHMLTRLGFSQVEKLLKWDGKPHRIWIRPGISDDPEILRSQLGTVTQTVT